jgi:hypothetical protein
MRPALTVSRGVEPLTGDDIAEVVVFAASRRENVVIADTLVFPSHQVSFQYFQGLRFALANTSLGCGWCHAPQGMSIVINK